MTSFQGAGQGHEGGGAGPRQGSLCQGGRGRAVQSWESHADMAGQGGGGRRKCPVQAWERETRIPSRQGSAESATSGVRERGKQGPVLGWENGY